MDLFRLPVAMLWKDAIVKNPPTWFSEEEPLRAELFSAQQMAQHGYALARTHRIQSGRIREALLARLTLNERVLADTVRLLSDALRAERTITPAGEWLLDNYYLIDENIRTARRHLPKGYSNELPQLAEGSSAGLPRVYDIALEAIAHGDGRVELHIEVEGRATRAWARRGARCRTSCRQMPSCAAATRGLDKSFAT